MFKAGVAAMLEAYNAHASELKLQGLSYFCRSSDFEDFRKSKDSLKLPGNVNICT